MFAKVRSVKIFVRIDSVLGFSFFPSHFCLKKRPNIFLKNFISFLDSSQMFFFFFYLIFDLFFGGNNLESFEFSRQTVSDKLASLFLVPSNLWAAKSFFFFFSSYILYETHDGNGYHSDSLLPTPYFLLSPCFSSSSRSLIFFFPFYLFAVLFNDPINFIKFSVMNFLNFKTPIIKRKKIPPDVLLGPRFIVQRLHLHTLSKKKKKKSKPKEK